MSAVRRCSPKSIKVVFKRSFKNDECQYLSATGSDAEVLGGDANVVVAKVEQN